MTESTIGIDRDQMQTFLRVVEAVDQLPHHHPDAVAVREATARIFKNVKLRPRAERQAAVRAADARRDRGHRHGRPRTASTTRPPGCRWPPRRPAPPPARWSGRCPATPARPATTTVDAFYHQLCPPCAALNRSRRDARTDLTGRRRCSPAGAPRSACTSRCGCCATARTRPSPPASRTTRCAGSAPCPTAPTGCTGCGSSASTCATRRRWSRSPTRSPPRGPLDILINNAAQTVRRSPGAYSRPHRGRVRAAARRRAAGDDHLRAHQRRAPAGPHQLAGQLTRS